MTDDNKSLDDVKKLVESPEAKPFKLKKLPSKSKLKRNFVHVLYIQDNGIIKPMNMPIEEGTTSIEGAARLATSGYILNYNGIPTVIQPAWSVEPFSKLASLDKAEKEGTLAVGQRLLANRIELGIIKAKKKLSGLMIFFGVIALIVIVYLLLS